MRADWNSSKEEELGAFERSLLSAGIPHCRLNWRIILSESGAQYSGRSREESKGS